jgi:hypothetical protein
MNTAAATATKHAPAPEATATDIAKEIARARIEEASIACGPLMRLTLPDDDTIAEGPQDIAKFGAVTADLHPGGWLEVTNDADSFYGLFRVAQLLGTRSTGCRGLVLQALMPPRKFDRVYEPPQATGSWHVRYMGGFMKWCVISPTGTIYRQHIATENEAQHVVIARMTSARPL